MKSWNGCYQRSTHPTCNGTAKAFRSAATDFMFFFFLFGFASIVNSTFILSKYWYRLMSRTGWKSSETHEGFAPRFLSSALVSGDSNGPSSAVRFALNNKRRVERSVLSCGSHRSGVWYSYRLIGSACYMVAGLVKVYWVSPDTGQSRSVTHLYTHAHKHSQREWKGLGVGRSCRMVSAECRT